MTKGKSVHSKVNKGKLLAKDADILNNSNSNVRESFISHEAKDLKKVEEMFAEKLDQDVKDTIAIEQVRDKISLFGALSNDQISALTSHAHVIDVKAGDSIFQQGQLPCNVYVLLKGAVRMDIHREDESQVSMEYKVGDCFGETAVIGIQPQLGHAYASQSASLMVISRTCLLDLVATDKELFAMLMMNIARESSRRLHAIIASPEKHFVSSSDAA